MPVGSQEQTKLGSAEQFTPEQQAAAAAQAREHEAAQPAPADITSDSERKVKP